MNFILNRDILNTVSDFLSNDDLFFYVQTCRDFNMSVNKKIYFPCNSVIFSDMKYLDWVDDFKDFYVNKLYMFNLAIMHGNCDVLDYIHYKLGNKYMSSNLYIDACYNKNSIEKLNWLKKNKCYYDESIKYSSFDILLTDDVNKWIKNELIFDEDNFYNFLNEKKNDTHSIEWVLKSIPRFREDFFELAVTLNDIKLLNWGIENGLPLSVHSCSRAASIGNIEILKYLRNKKCPWNAWTTTEAASNGHIDILDWAYSNGCPLESYALVDAVTNKHNHIVEWLLKHNCPIDEFKI